MKRRFILCLGPGATEDQHNAFGAFLQMSYPNAGWWHRIPDAWLIMDVTNEGLKAPILRDAVKAHYPSIHCLVLEFRKDGTSTWAGFGPSSGPLDWFTWIRDQWVAKF